jgi:hypothetical protein
MQEQLWKNQKNKMRIAIDLQITPIEYQTNYNFRSSGR